MKLNPIHQSPEERNTSSFQEKVIQGLEKTNEALPRIHVAAQDRSDVIQGFNEVGKKLDYQSSMVDELKDYIDHPEVPTRKLEEIKSAQLITNKHLKEIAQNTQKDEEIGGVEIVRLKGLPGEKGDKGDKGDKGEDGKDGKDSTVPGPQGPKGEKGNDGRDGGNGPAGKDGENGSADTPDEVVEKVNTASKKIKLKQVEGLSTLIHDVEQITRHPVGTSGAGGGAPAFVIQDEGIRVTDNPITAIDFTGSGVTASYSNNGKVTVNVTAGGGSVSDVAYDATWNGDTTTAPSKNAVYDKIETLLAAGGITRTITTSSGGFTAGSSASTDYVYLIAGAHAVALPTAVSNTNRYTFKNNHSAAITITPNGAETIEGTATIQVAPEDSVDLISNNSNWFVI